MERWHGMRLRFGGERQEGPVQDTQVRWESGPAQTNKRPQLWRVNRDSVNSPGVHPEPKTFQAPCVQGFSRQVVYYVNRQKSSPSPLAAYFLSHEQSDLCKALD